MHMSEVPCKSRPKVQFESALQVRKRGKNSRLFNISFFFFFDGEHSRVTEMTNGIGLILQVWLRILWCRNQAKFRCLTSLISGSSCKAESTLHAQGIFLPCYCCCLHLWPGSIPTLGPGSPTDVGDIDPSMWKATRFGNAGPRCSFSGWYLPDWLLGRCKNNSGGGGVGGLGGGSLHGHERLRCCLGNTCHFFSFSFHFPWCHCA